MIIPLNIYLNIIVWTITILYIYIYIKILKKKWQDGIWHDIFWYLNDLLGAVTVSIHQGHHISACWGFTMLSWVWPGAIVLLIWLISCHCSPPSGWTFLSLHMEVNSILRLEKDKNDEAELQHLTHWQYQREFHAHAWPCICIQCLHTCLFVCR